MSTIRGNVFTKDLEFVYGEVEYENGKILSVTPLSKTEAKDQPYIVPGLVDIHSHGCFGHDTCDGDFDGLKAMIDFERSMGTTSYLPTTMTFFEDRLTSVVENVAKLEKQEKSERGRSTIKGIYLEGPFISKDKCGAQNPAFIMLADLGMVDRLNDASNGLVKVVAIAPETEGAMDFIDNAHDKYCLSIAHTAADYETAKLAMNKGAKHVTHFYNAMPGYTHRAPGVIGAAMEADDVMVELIADGIHVHPAVVKNTFKQFGSERVILISDSMEATGMPNGKYALGGQDVYMKDRKATLADGTIAGSASTLFDCVKEAVKMGVRLEDAITAATKSPAVSVGIFDKVGSIEPGKDADMLVLSPALDLLEVI